ncbi:MAG: hypothetical protein K2N85_15645 [Lachnospiraceae bacterium]|nr:hypothetical protein [Lachnospiraceae bacterium]
MLKAKLSKNKKRIILLSFSILALIAGSICYLYFDAEHIQRRIKEKICAKVIEHEAELLEIVEECQEEAALTYRKIESNDNDNQYALIYYYKELNNEIISKAFRDFYLSMINKQSDGSVRFHVRDSIVSFLWDDYRCGFYYSEDDKPIDAVWTHKMDEDETEFEDLIFYGEYWYRTEKITDNWWFYETKTVYTYATHR